jgi:hypothetical protein
MRSSHHAHDDAAESGHEDNGTPAAVPLQQHRRH